MSAWIYFSDQHPVDGVDGVNSSLGGAQRWACLSDGLDIVEVCLVEISTGNLVSEYYNVIALTDPVSGLLLNPAFLEAAVAWRTPDDLPQPLGESTFYHNVNRYHVIETVEGVESVLGNYDYASEAGANGYIATFGGTRNLRVGYFAELTGVSAGGHQSFAVFNNSESLVEVKTTLAAATGYAGIFGYTDIRVLEETTEPIA